MNAQELIGSGLLEAYVLGQASADEARLVERMRKEHPDVARELEAIELSLETHAMKQAVKPADKARAAIMQAIDELPGRVIPLNGSGARRNDQRWVWLAAASIAMLVASAAMNFMLFRQMHDLRSQLSDLQADRSVLAEELRVQRASLDLSQHQLAVVMDPHKQLVHLAGQALDPAAGARVFYDPGTRELYLQVTSLPAAPAGKQYQFWAQVDGQMVDAGLIATDTAGILRMKDMLNATAFGVTLENEGGSPTPTLTALYLLGAIQGT